MGDFKPFAAALAKHFANMSKHEMYRTEIDGQEVWDAYLAAFPAGTNEIFRVRTYHDGSYDRNVIRRIGNVIAIVNGELLSIWDIPNLEYPYDVVAKTLSGLVKSNPINSLFRINEKKLGYVSTTERLEDGSIKTWDHFHVDIATKHQSKEVDTVLGKARTTVEMFQRAYAELNKESIDTILDLISENAIYRGSEFKGAVTGFRDLCIDYGDSSNKANFLWVVASQSPHARFRNTAIGTLATDLSNGEDLESAVKSFEAKVAPTNYKRPTALITQGMIKEAMKTIKSMNLEDALKRRYATLSDISVNNVLWANKDAVSKMKGGLEDMLMGEVVQTKKASNAENIRIEDFLRDVLPKAGTMEILFKNNLQSNLVSITAPVHEDVEQLFKWENNFGWSYNGEITDSIKERVKAAGGNVKAKLRVSLAWFNGDDLDLHSSGPSGHIFYGNPGGLHYGKNRILDVDMNAGSRSNDVDPVENQSWNDPKDGNYKIMVNNYSKRDTRDPGFQVDVVCGGQHHSLSFRQVIRSRDTVEVATFTMRKGEMLNFKVSDDRITHEGISTNVWGINTETFVPVTSLMLSPNHWDDNSIGNKHWFFLIDGCVNPDGTRGIYNEFLKGELDKHRKVFEVLGSKTRCEPSNDQLSGLGFSSTQSNEVTVRVAGSKINKTYNIKFN